MGWVVLDLRKVKEPGQARKPDSPCCARGQMLLSFLNTVPLSLCNPEGLRDQDDERLMEIKVLTHYY